mmetsp:Transcript_169729/g.544707  ORF Transcript_169729/g.544707 Transcript_169729/m.544707 type:complete len:292 (+) Transcript_169729:770-1645(+)
MQSLPRCSRPKDRHGRAGGHWLSLLRLRPGPPKPPARHRQQRRRSCSPRSPRSSGLGFCCGRVWPAQTSGSRRSGSAALWMLPWRQPGRRYSAWSPDHPPPATSPCPDADPLLRLVHMPGEAPRRQTERGRRRCPTISQCMLRGHARLQGRQAEKASSQRQGRTSHHDRRPEGPAQARQRHSQTPRPQQWRVRGFVGLLGLLFEPASVRRHHDLRRWLLLSMAKSRAGLRLCDLASKNRPTNLAMVRPWSFRANLPAMRSKLCHHQRLLGLEAMRYNMCWLRGSQQSWIWI